MSGKNWTAGPWNIVDGGTCMIGGTMHYTCEIEHVKVNYDYRGPICSVQSCDNFDEGIHIDEAEANANLIAAAPDLYEALERMVYNAEQTEFEQWLDQTCPHGDVSDVNAQWLGSSAYSEFCDMYETELSALAKARGESQ